MPGKIASLEAEQKSISDKLADGDFYKNATPDEVKKLNERFAEIDELLLLALERWEVLGG